MDALKSGVVEFRCEHFKSAPQLKRDPLGCASHPKAILFVENPRGRPRCRSWHPSGWFGSIGGATQMKVPLCGGRGDAGEIRASVHPGSQSRCGAGEGWAPSVLPARDGPEL